MRSAAWLIVAGLGLLPARTPAQKVTLRVGATDLSAASPAAGTIAGVLSNQVSWRQAQPGLHWAELELNAGALGLPVRAILARIDPRQFEFELQTLLKANRVSGAWTIDSVPPNAALALNAGQFKEAGPWGWVVLDGVTENLPGPGSLAAAIAFDTAGAVHWLAPAQLVRARHDRAIRYAFQSYPLLLLNGAIPKDALNKRLVDLAHRDARLVFAQQADGLLLIVLTRFDALGGRVERVPIGLTLPETVVLMRALGARHAIMLDGGISAQMIVREANGNLLRWPGLRAVPLALIASPR